MRILCAPDKFKQACTAAEAADALAEGARAGDPDADVRVLPLADGGEGTLDVLREVLPVRRPVPARDALGRDVPTIVALSTDGKRALIESSQACGLWRLEEGERNPMEADTFGVGQMIAAALDAGATELLIGLGGSATCDGGAGMLTALGAKLTGANDAEIEPGGRALKNIRRADLSGLDPRLKQARITALCDVASPMLGPNAATRKFTVQKGGSTRTMHKLEENLALLAQCVQNEGVKATGFEPGSGAAGGLGYGVLALGGTLVPGAAKLLELIGFAEMLEGVDLVLTGEGSYDEQTADGKLINALADACQQAGVPLVVLAGVAKPVDIKGVTAAFSINLPGKRKQDNLDDTKQNLKNHAASVVKVMTAARSRS